MGNLTKENIFSLPSPGQNLSDTNSPHLPQQRRWRILIRIIKLFCSQFPNKVNPKHTPKLNFAWISGMFFLKRCLWPGCQPHQDGRAACRRLSTTTCFAGAVLYSETTLKPSTHKSQSLCIAHICTMWNGEIHLWELISATFWVSKTASVFAHSMSF